MKFIVVGDLMVDHTVYGEVHKISPEAPVPVVDVTHETKVLGGAANVAKNLTSLGHEVILVGNLGPQGLRLCDDDWNIDTSYSRLVDKDNIKLRYVDTKTGYHLIRIDNESSLKYESVKDGPWQYPDEIKPDGIILSDYCKNVLDGNIKHVIRAARARRIPVFVDTRRADARIFEGANWMMPNLKELKAIKESLSTGEDYRVVQILELDGLIVTLSEAGMRYVREDGYTSTIPPTSTQIVDVTGAGDTAMAAFAIGICQGHDPEEAMGFANFCAGIACCKRGTATVDKEEAASYHRIRHGIYR